MWHATDDDGARPTIDELRLVEIAAEGPSHSDRVLGAWAAALVAIASLALVGHLFEAPSPGCCEAVAAPAVGPGRMPLPLKPTPERTVAAIAVAASPERPARAGRPRSLVVEGSIDGPVGMVEIRLEDGESTLDVVTRHFAPIDGRPPAPAGRFTAELLLPADLDAGRLRLIVRAFVGDRIVGSLERSVLGSIEPPSRPLPTWPRPASTRLGGLPWLTDPYAS